METRYLAIYTPGGPQPQEVRVFGSLRHINMWREDRNINSYDIEVLEIFGRPVNRLDWYDL